MNKELYIMQEKDINKFAEFLVETYFENNLIKYVLNRKYSHNNALLLWKSLLKCIFNKGVCIANYGDLEILTLIILDSEKHIKINEIIKNLGIKASLIIGFRTIMRLNYYLNKIKNIKKNTILNGSYIIGTAIKYNKDSEYKTKEFNKKVLTYIETLDDKFYYKINKNEEILMLEQLGFKTKIIKIIPEINIVYGVMVKKRRK